jgi:hypothetical protein
MRIAVLAAASLVLRPATATTSMLRDQSTCTDKNEKNPGPCAPGHEQCGKPFDKDTSPVPQAFAILNLLIETLARQQVPLALFRCAPIWPIA